MATMTNDQFYEASNLTTNPFRTTPVVEADPRMGIWVGYDKERETLVKYLTRTRADQVGNNNFILVYGDYGIGKSHALLWSKHLILNTETESFESVAFYIPTLKKAKGQISFAGIPQGGGECDIAIWRSNFYGRRAAPARGPALAAPRT